MPVNIRSRTFTYQSSIELTIAPVRSFLLARARLGWMAAGASMYGHACRAHGIPIHVRVRTGGTESSSFSSNGSLHLSVLIINFLSFPGRARICAIDCCLSTAVREPRSLTRYDGLEPNRFAGTCFNHFSMPKGSVFFSFLLIVDLEIHSIDAMERWQ